MLRTPEVGRQLALDSAAGTHPSHPIPRTSRTLSSEPTDLLEPQPLGICPKRRLFSLVLQVDFALRKGSTPPHFPAGIPTECRTGFTETVANGTQAPRAPWTHCLSRASGCFPTAVLLLPFCPGNSQFHWFLSFPFPQGGIQIFRKQPQCTN